MKTSQIQFRINPKNKHRCRPDAEPYLFKWSAWCDSEKPKKALARARRSERIRSKNLGRKVLFEFRIKP